MSMLSAIIRHTLERELGLRIIVSEAVSGGCINDARILHTTDGLLFLKQNTNADLLEAEVVGLQALADANVLRVPEVMLLTTVNNKTLLVLEFIKSGHRSTTFWEQFGSGLAALHRQTAPQFGFSSDNFIGSLPQFNGRYHDWMSFYWVERIQPQLQMALQVGLLQLSDEQAFDRLYRQFDRYFPQEPPTLTHGDLWSGNFLCDESEQAVLIDPAVSYSHREMDIAMTHLFGGFDASFYTAYESAYPLVPDFQERLPLYQLYYLLAHVNLFGGSYMQSVRRILERFV